MAGWETLPPPPPMRPEGANGQLAAAPAPNPATDPNAQDKNSQKERKGIFDKLKGIFH